jgi:hypothetical protein
MDPGFPLVFAPLGFRFRELVRHFFLLKDPGSSSSLVDRRATTTWQHQLWISLNLSSMIFLSASGMFSGAMCAFLHECWQLPTLWYFRQRYVFLPLIGRELRPVLGVGLQLLLGMVKMSLYVFPAATGLGFLDHHSSGGCLALAAVSPFVEPFGFLSTVPPAPSVGG